ncbi:MAG TPA: hypothetical protein VF757_01535 [Sphingomicrobium sp.]
MRLLSWFALVALVVGLAAKFGRDTVARPAASITVKLPPPRL